MLKKTLKDFFNKGFIKANNSLTITLIFFIKKLNEGLRFYYNYYVLNIIIKINRYPLPFIKETFKIIIKAK